MEKNINGLEVRTPDWADYELIDSGDFEKLERFGRWVTVRPEPQAIWRPSLSQAEWERLATAVFRREAGSEERGRWLLAPSMPEQWTVKYSYKGMALKMRLGLTSFKHVGIFPEQADNWNFIYDSVTEIIAGTDKLDVGLRTGGVGASKTVGGEAVCGEVGAKGESGTRNERGVAGASGLSGSRALGNKPKVLNLFAYTGGASLAACSAGADVTHVDSVKQVVSWSRENMELSGLSDIRWVVEDALKFVRREVKRGKKYDGIIMDPPAYGRGPEGEKWVLEQDILELLELCGQLLSPRKSFMVVNLYSMGLSALVAKSAVNQIFPKPDMEQYGELCFLDRAKKTLPLGVYYRCRYK